ncbi:MAG: type IX secretion system membrane protein PorP/SprF [Flavobacterium sp.]
MKNTFKKIIKTLLVSIVFITSSYGQYPLNNRLFQENKFSMNVAYAGEENSTRLSVVNNYIPSKVDNGNNSYWILGTFDVGLTKNLATGTRLSYNLQGAFLETVIEQALAYKLNINEEQSVALGISFGLNRQVFDPQRGLFPNQFVDMEDKVFDGNSISRNDLRTEIGAVYKFKKFELSVALPTLMQDNNFASGFLTYASYNFATSTDIEIKPSILINRTYQKDFEITSSINFMYLEKGWLQLGYLDTNQLLIGAGIRFEKVGIAYSAAIPFNEKYTSLIGNAHQLGLYFKL